MRTLVSPAIRMFQVGAFDKVNVWWSCTGGKASGTLDLNAPLVSGSYEFRDYLQDTYHKVATSSPVVAGGSSYSLTPASLNPAGGAPLSVSFTAPGGSAASDWVGCSK